MEQPWVVVPCYNEARRLDRAAFAAGIAGDTGATFVLVDDGSTDDTATALAGIAATNPARCRVVILAENRGKAEAVRIGMRTALEEGAGFVAYWDADLATPLTHVADFATLLDDRPEIDVVMGARVRMLGRHIHRSGARHLIGRAYATLASVVLGLPVYDTQCGAKMFRRSTALEHALDQPFRSRWSFDVELLQRLQHGWGDRGLDRIVEVPLPEWRDVGSSNVSLTAGGAAFAVLFALLLRNNRSLPLERGADRVASGERAVNGAPAASEQAANRGQARP
jgi:dolichyl-phosphate beta-glucosyltransferase